MAAGTSVTFEPKNAADLANFFKASKDMYHEIWIVITKKKQSDLRPVTFSEAVAEAVKQGLIDSRTKRLNEHKYMIRFTKRISRKADA